MGERAGPSGPPPTFEGAPNEKAWAQAHVHQHPHLGPTRRSTHRWFIGPAGLLGANPNHRSAPLGPFPRGLASQRWGWGHRAQVPDSPCCPSATRAARGPPVNQGRRMVRALRASADVHRPPALKRLGSCSGSPAPSPRPNPPCVAQPLIGSTGLLGANRNPRSTPSSPSQGAWCRNAGDWGPPSLSTGLILPPSRHAGAWGGAVHSGWENGQSHPRHRDLQRLPGPKQRGPRSCSPAPSPRSATPVSTQLANRASGLLGAKPNTRLAPRGPPKGPGAATLGIGDTRAAAPD